MRYSLLSRFQGGWLGSAIGALRGWGEPEFCAELRLGGAIADCLIRRDPWQPEVCLQSLQCRSDSFAALPAAVQRSKIALAVLPIIFDNCEDLESMRSRLEDIAAAEQLSAATLEDLKVWGEAIALILSENMALSPWLFDLLERYDQRQSPLGKMLAKTSQLINAEKGLRQAIGELSDRDNPDPLAIALYCFAGTPSDFRLCVTRAQQVERFARLTAALTGAIAGAHNGFQGIPTAWRLQALSDPQVKRIARQAEQLFAAWSGVYPLSHSLSPRSAIAPAGTLQPRRSLKIVSQHPSSRYFHPK